MPVCNMCAEPFDVEVTPGGLLFGHPSTVTQCVPVPKAHLCQACEAEIIGAFKLPPIDPQADRIKAMEGALIAIEARYHAPNISNMAWMMWCIAKEALGDKSTEQVTTGDGK